MVTQLYPTLCDPMNYIVHGILQARILEWVAFPSPGDLPKLRINPRSPVLHMDSLPVESQWKPKDTGVGSLSLLQQIFLTQQSTRDSCIAGRSFNNNYLLLLLPSRFSRV